LFLLWQCLFDCDLYTEKHRSNFSNRDLKISHRLLFEVKEQ